MAAASGARMAAFPRQTGSCAVRQTRRSLTSTTQSLITRVSCHSRKLAGDPFDSKLGIKAGSRQFQLPLAATYARQSGCRHQSTRTSALCHGRPASPPPARPAAPQPGPTRALPPARAWPAGTRTGMSRMSARYAQLPESEAPFLSGMRASSQGQLERRHVAGSHRCCLIDDSISILQWQNSHVQTKEQGQKRCPIVCQASNLQHRKQMELLSNKHVSLPQCRARRRTCSRGSRWPLTKSSDSMSSAAGPSFSTASGADVSAAAMRAHSSSSPLRSMPARFDPRVET